MALFGREEIDTGDEEHDDAKMVMAQAGAVLLAEAILELRIIREAVAGKAS